MSHLARIKANYLKLVKEQKVAAFAAVVLILSELLPWYGGTVAAGPAGLVQIDRSYSAFGVFSLVELALILTAVFVLALLWARLEVDDLHLPLGEGTLITGAGVWSLLLLLFRTLDRPEIQATKLGLEWGMLVAFAAAAVMLGSGLRLRERRLGRSAPEGDNRG